MGPVRNNGRKRLVSEINVTPLVDVMLVLLIIFMVTAPMMTQGLDIDLPETTAKSLPQNDDIQIITLDKNGTLNLNGNEVPKATLFQMLESANKEEPIYLKADKEIAYGNVVTLMADLKSAGFEKLGMVTKPEDKTK